MTARVHRMPFGATVTPAGVDFAFEIARRQGLAQERNRDLQGRQFGDESGVAHGRLPVWTRPILGSVALSRGQRRVEPLTARLNAVARVAVQRQAGHCGDPRPVASARWPGPIR